MEVTYGALEGKNRLIKEYIGMHEEVRLVLFSADMFNLESGYVLVQQF